MRRFGKKKTKNGIETVLKMDDLSMVWACFDRLWTLLASVRRWQYFGCAYFIQQHNVRQRMSFVRLHTYVSHFAYIVWMYTYYIYSLLLSLLNYQSTILMFFSRLKWFDWAFLHFIRWFCVIFSINKDLI